MACRSESEDTRTGNDGVIGRPCIKCMWWNAGARWNLGLQSRAPKQSPFLPLNDNQPTFSTEHFLPSPTERQPTYFRLTISCERQPNNLLTLLQLCFYWGLMRFYRGLTSHAFWASEIIRGRDISMMITTLTVASWEKLWELRAISIMITILTFLLMIKVRWAEDELVLWVLCHLWQRALAFRAYCFSGKSNSTFPSRVTPRVPRLELFCFMTAYYIPTYTSWGLNHLSILQLAS